MSDWLAISKENIKLDKDILIRTPNRFGFGHGFDTVKFDSKLFSKQEAADSLLCEDYVELMEIPE